MMYIVSIVLFKFNARQILMRNYTTYFAFICVLVFGTSILHAQELEDVSLEMLANQQSESSQLESYGFTGGELPVRYSLEDYGYVSTQNGGSCVGFAVTSAINIMHNVINEYTSFDFKFVNTFDPYYFYCAIKDDNDLNCIGEECNCGSYITDALEILTLYGAKKNNLAPSLDCGNNLNTTNLRSLNPMTSSYSVDDYYNLFSYPQDAYGEYYVEYNLDDFKWAISNNYPIVTGINVDDRFSELGVGYGGSLYKASENSDYGHAVTIVGYDDFKYGGAFRVMNSYGSDWGDNGYFWLTYKDYFASSYQAYILVNESWDKWNLESSVVKRPYYRGFSEDNTVFWEGLLDESGFLDGRGIEYTTRHVAIGSYENGYRNGWWVILEKSSVEDPWKGFVLFEDDEVVDSESFGFASFDNEKQEFSNSLHLDNFEIDLNENIATEGDVKVEKIRNKIDLE